MRLKELVKLMKNNENDIIAGLYTPHGIVLVNKTSGEYIIYNNWKRGA